MASKRSKTITIDGCGSVVQSTDKQGRTSTSVRATWNPIAAIRAQIAADEKAAGRVRRQRVRARGAS